MAREYSPLFVTIMAGTKHTRGKHKIATPSCVTPAATPTSTDKARDGVLQYVPRGAACTEIEQQRDARYHISDENTTHLDDAWWPPLVGPSPPDCHKSRQPRGDAVHAPRDFCLNITSSLVGKQTLREIRKILGWAVQNVKILRRCDPIHQPCSFSSSTSSW